jgi:hypothetical protein
LNISHAPNEARFSFQDSAMSEAPQQIDGRKALLYRQREVNYTPMSPTPGESQCAGCRFFIPSGSWTGGSEPSSGSTCAIVESYPLSILPTGLCDEYAALPLDANEPEPMAVVIIEDDMERGYIAPLPVKPGVLKRLFGAKDPPAVTVFRGDDGLRRAIHITSNGYRDREQEHVATKALQDYVESQFKDGEWHGDNVLDFWHTLDIGDLEAACMVDGFLVEVSRERRAGPLIEKLWDYWEESAQDGSVVWGTSHEFRAARDGDTFVRIKKKKTSVLPVEAAANLYTYSEILPMTADFEKHLDKALGITGAATILRDKGINALNEELRKRGEVAKGNQPDADKPTPAAPPGAVVDWTPLLSELLEAAGEHQKTIDAQAQELTALKTAGETRQKAADTTAGTLKTVQDEVAALKKQLADFKADTPRRASEDNATRLSGEDEAKAKADIEKRTTKFDPSFPGMNVPLPEGGK